MYMYVEFTKNLTMKLKKNEALNLFQKLMSHSLTLKREYATIKGINYSY